jgi:hypothetical protein
LGLQRSSLRPLRLNLLLVLLDDLSDFGGKLIAYICDPLISFAE